MVSEPERRRKNGDGWACDGVRSPSYRRTFRTPCVNSTDALDGFRSADVGRQREFRHIRNGKAPYPATTPANLAPTPEIGDYATEIQNRRSSRRSGKPARAELPRSVGEPYSCRRSAHSYPPSPPANHSRIHDFPGSIGKPYSQYQSVFSYHPPFPANHSRSKGMLESRPDFSHFDGEFFDGDYLDWEQEVEEFCAHMDMSQVKLVKYVARKLVGRAGAWWEHLTHARRAEGRRNVETWSKMKRLLRSQFLPSRYKKIKDPNIFNQLHSRFPSEGRDKGNHWEDELQPRACSNQTDTRDQSKATASVDEQIISSLFYLEEQHDPCASNQIDTISSCKEKEKYESVEVLEPEVERPILILEEFEHKLEFYNREVLDDKFMEMRSIFEDVDNYADEINDRLTVSWLVTVVMMGIVNVVVEETVGKLKSYRKLQAAGYSVFSWLHSTVLQSVSNKLYDNRPHRVLVVDASPLEIVSIRELELFAEWDQRVTPLWVALDEVTDPQNLGTIIRSTYFFGAEGVVLCAKASTPLSEVVGKASAGSLELIRLRPCKNMMKFWAFSMEKGWRFLGGLVSSKALTLREVEAGLPTILVLGSEGHSLRPLVERSCTQLIRNLGSMAMDSISRGPEVEGKYMDHKHFGQELNFFLAVESLNVNVAVGMLLYHLVGDAKHFKRDKMNRIRARIRYVTIDPNQFGPPCGGVCWNPSPSERCEFKYPRPPKPIAPRIYEAHVGMSGLEPRTSTYREFADDILPRIQSNNYNTIQLLAFNLMKNFEYKVLQEIASTLVQKQLIHYSFNTYEVPLLVPPA